VSDLFELLFELSNEDRVNILNLVQMEHLNLTKISNKLGLRNQEASRHLSRLEGSGLVLRKSDGTYETTAFAELVLIKQGEIGFLLKYKDYFNSHSIQGIPDSLVARLGVLSKSTFVDDTLIALQVVKRIIEESEKYLYRISDQFLMVLLDPIVDATERGINYYFIYSSEIKLPPDFKDTVRLRKAQRNGNFFSYTHENIRAFMVMSEKEVMLAFPQMDDGYDYTGFNSTDKAVLQWCTELYEYHNNNKKSPLPLWEDIP
jgi:predicted transcriptional regulator